jgi:hypothetical protein
VFAHDFEHIPKRLSIKTATSGQRWHEPIVDQC